MFLHLVFLCIFGVFSESDLEQVALDAIAKQLRADGWPNCVAPQKPFINEASTGEQCNQFAVNNNTIVGRIEGLFGSDL